MVRGVFVFEIGSESEPRDEPFRKLAPFRSLGSKNNANFWSVASILMPLLKAESGYGIKIDAIKENISLDPYVFRFPMIYPLRGISKIFGSTHKNRASYSLLSEGL